MALMTNKMNEDYLTRNIINPEEEEKKHQHRTTRSSSETLTDKKGFSVNFPKPVTNIINNTAAADADDEDDEHSEALIHKKDPCRKVPTIQLPRDPHIDPNDETTHRWIHVSFRYELVANPGLGSWIINKVRHGDEEACRCNSCKRIGMKMSKVQIEMMNEDDENECDCTMCDSMDKATDRLPILLGNGTHSVSCKCKVCETKSAHILRQRQILADREEKIQTIWFFAMCIAAVVLIMALSGGIRAVFGPDYKELSKQDYLNKNFEKIPPLPYMIHFDEEGEVIIALTNETKACCCSSKEDNEGCWCYPDHTEKVSKAFTSEINDMKELERRDVWKFHTCHADCLDCGNLVDACLYFNAQGACQFVNERCHDLNDTHWREQNNICQLGCLNCHGLRKQCMNKNDVQVCNTYFRYCEVNYNKKEMELFQKEATHQVCVGNSFYVEIMKKAQLQKLTPEQCEKLKQECNSGYKMNNMIACVHWIFECDTAFRKQRNKELQAQLEVDEGDENDIEDALEKVNEQPEAKCSAMPKDKRGKKL